MPCDEGKCLDMQRQMLSTCPARHIAYPTQRLWDMCDSSCSSLALEQESEADDFLAAAIVLHLSS